MSCFPGADIVQRMTHDKWINEQGWATNDKDYFPQQQCKKCSVTKHLERSKLMHLKHWEDTAGNVAGIEAYWQTRWLIAAVKYEKH